MSIFVLPRVAHPDFYSPGSPIQDHGGIDWENKALTQGLWDCRTYRSQKVFNLVDGTSNALGTSSAVAKGWRGQDITSGTIITLPDNEFQTYTKLFVGIPDALSGDNMISGGNTRTHAFWFNSNQIQCGHNGSWSATNVSASIGTFYIVVATYDGTDIKLFVNGKKVDEAASSAPSGSGGECYIFSYDASNYYDGRCFLTGIWDRAVSEYWARQLSFRPSILFKPTADIIWSSEEGGAPPAGGRAPALTLLGVS